MPAPLQFGQYSAGGTSSPHTVAFTGVTAGSALAVFVSFSLTGAPTLSVSDDVNGAWSLIGRVDDVGRNQGVAVYGVANSAAGALTVSFGASPGRYLCLFAAEWGGADTTSPFADWAGDVFATNVTAEDALTSGEMTLSSGTGTVFAICLDNLTGVAPDEGTDHTSIEEAWGFNDSANPFAGSTPYARAEYRDVAAGDHEATFTGAPGNGSTVIAVIIKDAGGGGPVVHEMELSATHTQSPSGARQRVSLKDLSATAAQVVSRLRSVARPLSAVAVQTTGSAPVRTGLGLGRSAAHAQTLTRTRGLAVSRSATATQTPSRARSLTRAMAVVVAAVVSLVKGQQYGRTVSATHTQSPTRTRSVQVSRSITATQTPSRGRLVTRALAAVSAAVVSLAKGQSFGRTLGATHAATPSRARQLALPRAGAHAQAPSRERALGLPRAATHAQTPSRSRAFSRALSAVATQAASRLRAVYRTLALAAAQSATVDQQQQGGGPTLMTLSATATQTVALVRALARALATGQAQAPSRTRALTRPALVATAAASPSVAAGRSYLRTVSTSAVQVPARARELGVRRGATAGQTPTAARRAERELAAPHGQAPSAGRGLFRSHVATATQAPSESHNQGQFMMLVATVVQVPARAVQLGLSRTASAVQTSVVGRAVSRTVSAVHTQLGSVRRFLAVAFAVAAVQVATLVKGRKYFVDLATAHTAAPTVELDQESAAVEPAGPGRIAHSRRRRRIG